MKNRTAFVTGVKKMEVCETGLPVYRDDEVLVKIAYCGICGSDLHFYENGENGFRDVYPFTLGHECSGVVEAVGSLVTTHKVGDRVALEPGKTCGKCEWCKAGKYNLCPHVEFLSAPRCQGAMRDYVAHPAELCFHLPDSVSLRSGALIEPLAVGIHAVRQAGTEPGKTVVILGSGCIGLVTLLAAGLFQADQIYVADLFDVRLNKARELGANVVIHSAEADVTSQVMRLTGGVGADIVFETAGSPVTTALTSKLVKRGGTITLVGNTSGETPFEFLDIMNREVDIKSVFRYRNIYPLAIRALAAHKIDVERIISAEFPLTEAKRAFDTALYEKQTNVKVVIKM